MTSRSIRRAPALIRTTMLATMLATGLWSCAGPDADSATEEDAGVVAGATNQDPGFTLPQPEGWRSETFSFPLPFAPDLPYRGVEEIRFAPGWSEQTAEDFWSYLFVWWIEPAGEVQAAVLEEQLEAYFRGLASGAEVDAAMVRDEVDAQLERTDVESGTSYRGQVRIVDTFATQAPLDLQMEARRLACPEAGRELWIFSWSPQSRDHEIWAQLDAIRSDTVCR